MVVLSAGNTHVSIDKGELISYLYAGTELMHQKGNPGWGQSDIEMFPLIGPAAQLGYQIPTPQGEGILEQHGLLRELPYCLVENGPRVAEYRIRYTANTTVKNAKFPDRSRAANLCWPYDFEWLKRFTLTSQGLLIEFTLQAAADMPFMLGYHPAFAIHTDTAQVVAGTNVITVDDVKAVGDRAYPVRDTEQLQLLDRHTLTLRTTGFGHFMLWTPTANMLCIEPITFYPYVDTSAQLMEGFQNVSPDGQHFSVLISVS